MFILIGYQFCPIEVEGNNLPFIANMVAWGFPKLVSSRCMKFKNVLYRIFIWIFDQLFFLQNKVVSGNGVCFELLTFYTR